MKANQRKKWVYRLNTAVSFAAVPNPDCFATAIEMGWTPQSPFERTEICTSST
jgi:hypothetical protein